jgi:hypothetical protein
MCPTARCDIRTRAEVGFDAAVEGDDLIHYSAFRVVLGRLSTWPISKTLSRSYSSTAITTNRPPMLGDRHRFGTGQVDQRPKPYLASFAISVFIRIPRLSEDGQFGRICNARGMADGPAPVSKKKRPDASETPRPALPHAIPPRKDPRAPAGLSLGGGRRRVAPSRARGPGMASARQDP